MTLLDELNAPQRQAVTAAPGPVLVLAGPGSGKTRVLTHRVAYLVRELGVQPWHIMAVTFTNKAAREMMQRVSDLLSGKPRGLTMGTFHATCARILRRETDHLTHYDRNFVIFDTADQIQVVKQALRDLNLDDKKFQPNKMRNGIGSAKNELVTPEAYQATNYISEVTRRVYARYQEILQANNAMDFDDLLMNTVLLLEAHPEILKRYQDQYEHILVDEFQDTNTVQYALLQRLAARHQNIFVVGDSDQSIYKWRGADFRNIDRFRNAYPEAQLILLEQNYRSTQIILDAAKAVIQRNPYRVHKELFTERADGERITVREAYNEHEEAEAVLNTMQNMMLEGYTGGDFAIMFRTNAQSRVLEEAFLRYGLSYRLVGATEFYKRREVKDIIAYLRLIHNPADMVSFDRIINTPPRGIGAKTRQQLMAWAAQNHLQPALATIRLATDPEAQHSFRGRAFKALSGFGSLLQGWITLSQQTSVGRLLDQLLEQIAYQHYLDDGTREGIDRWDNVMEFRGVAANDEATSLRDFLEQVALVSDTDNLEEGLNAPTLLTLHTAKGLEFPVVFITGLEDGILPHSRSLDDGESLAEERRLFYVGITRAKDRVFLSYAFRRSYFGDTAVTTPSRFLRDIPNGLVDGSGAAFRHQQTLNRLTSWDATPEEWSGAGQTADTANRHIRPTTRGSGRRRAFADTWRVERMAPVESKPESLPESNPRKPEPAYQSGQRVRHARFGEGTVIESKLTGSDEEVVVAFPEVGIKRLAASFANLELI